MDEAPEETNDEPIHHRDWTHHEIRRIDVEIRSVRHRLATGEQKDVHVATLLEQIVKDIGRIEDTVFGKAGLEVAMELLKHQAEHERIAKLTRGQTLVIWSGMIFGFVGMIVGIIGAWAAIVKGP